MVIQYLNPEADCLVPIKGYQLSVDLNRQPRLGLVINKIVDCDRFMSAVGAELLEAVPHLKIIKFDTGTITFADPELIDKIAAECDVAICAIGHCGSCTAGTVKDGIALIEKNCPSVALVTEHFWEQAEILARSLGWPDAPRVKLPYPVWGADDKTMEMTAYAAAKQILQVLDSR
ncbi:MAG: UGSC family (seleno)protein [bacterium]